MLAQADRDRIRVRLLELAREDPDVTSAAVTGSHATGSADQWSDIDLFFGVSGPLEGVLDRWTAVLYWDFGALHHWDLPASPAVYRVFLLPDWLEVDIGCTPAASFRPGGPSWQLIFGTAGAGQLPEAPPVRTMTGLAWHHALHARICIERGRGLQAEHWIGALRGQLIGLACARAGYPTAYAKGAHLLPPEVTGPLAATLVGSLDAAELNRALQAALTALSAELGRTDAELARALEPMLSQLAAGPNLYTRIEPGV